jgi:hypothetical protein
MTPMAKPVQTIAQKFFSIMLPPDTARHIPEREFLPIHGAPMSGCAGLRQSANRRCAPAFTVALYFLRCSAPADSRSSRRRGRCGTVTVLPQS